MNDDVAYRVASFVIAFVFGVLVPAWLLGPWAFDGVALGALQTWAKVSAVISGLFGLWLAIVASFVNIAALRKTVEPLSAGAGGGEAAILVLPYILLVGTRALWRRFHSANVDEA